jgi:hypothetical protein
MSVNRDEKSNPQTTQITPIERQDNDSNWKLFRPTSLFESVEAA